MSTIYHPFENRIISEEEAKQISDAAFREIEREAKQKANDDYSFIRYGNGETCHIKNEDINVFPTLYDKMMKYNIRNLENKIESYKAN